MGFMNILFPRRGRTVVRHYSADQAERKKEVNLNVFFWIMVVVSFILTGFTYHSYSVYKDIQRSLNDVIVNEPGLTPHPGYAGSVIHIAAPSNTIQPTKPLADIDFNLNIYGPFSMKREVEYCQWVEHQSTKTHKHSDGSETEETTYYYTKGWRSSTIPSVFFNQPGAHHNPQRDPYPSLSIVDSTDVNVGDGYTIDSNLAKHVSVKSEPVVNWDFNSHNNFLQSAAHKKDNFYYTNKNGWFYSPYSPSTSEKLAKMAVELMEGSLFDYQFADLFSACTAGDIRVRFRTKTPKGGVSLIGRQSDENGRIDTFKSIEDREVDIIYEGMHSASEVKNMKISDTFTTFVLFALGTLLSWVVTGFVLKNRNRIYAENDHEKGY